MEMLKQDLLQSLELLGMGGAADYAEMHGSPFKIWLLPFQNVWDEDGGDTK
jgi:hypothetical protein